MAQDFGSRREVSYRVTSVYRRVRCWDEGHELELPAGRGREWHWTGTRANEAPLDMRGVTLFEIKNGRIVSGRLYMEEVDQAGADIDETVRRLAGGDQPDDE